MGGHVFKNSAPIKREFIKITIDKYIKEFTRIFPTSKRHLDPVVTLGSVGKKDFSGDIDIAIDNKAFDNIEEWGLDKQEITELFAGFKKRARTATDDQLMKRAIIVAIANKIEKESDLIITDVKQSGSGALFCQFPQYNEKGEEMDMLVQIDINVGDIDWLKFAYYSDSYEGNVKGLHRTQLMLSLFAYKGYVFSHNYGVKNKTTQEIVANNPKEAIDLLNELYGFHITEKILQNYFELHKYMELKLKKDDLYAIYDIYLKILDSTRCDIPTDMQLYWVENQDRLCLKGKFLPNNSNLYPLKKD